MHPRPAVAAVPVKRPRGILAGGILLAIGMTLVIQALGVPYAASVLFIALGAAFTAPYVQDRRRYVYLVPGTVLIAVGLGYLLVGVFGEQAGGTAGALFLLAMAGGLGLIYVLEPRRWWPLVPAGAFALLALVYAFGTALIPDAIRPFLAASIATPAILIGVGIYLLLTD